MKREDEVRGVLWQFLGTWRKVEVVLLLLRLQVLCGGAFPSAKWLAGQVKCSEKTVDRLVTKLRALGLITTRRRVRPAGSRTREGVPLDGKWGTNEISLTPMMKKLALFVGAYLKKIRVQLGLQGFDSKAVETLSIEFLSAQGDRVVEASVHRGVESLRVVEVF